MILFAGQMPPQLDAVDPVVKALHAAVASVLDAEAAFGFEVAASEALTNIVVHGYAQIEGGGDISLSLCAEAQGVSLDIRDRGIPGPYDLYSRAATPESIDVMAESGRGLALIRHLADDIAYFPSAAGNRLVLTFRQGRSGFVPDG